MARLGPQHEESTAPDVAPAAAPSYDPHGYLADELAKLDVLLALRVQELQERHRARSPEARANPMVIADEEIAALLAERLGGAAPGADHLLDRRIAQMQAAIDARVSEGARQGRSLPLQKLAQIFSLTRFEQQALLVCLAPELDRRYDRIYAYLQDDITRKKASVDLVLDLLCRSPEERWRGRAAFSEAAPLLRVPLLEASDDPQSPSGSSGLAQFLRVEPRILGFLLGHELVDPRLDRCATLVLPRRAPSSDELARVVVGHCAAQQPGAPARRLVVHLGAACGRWVDDRIASACAAIGAPLLRVDVALLPEAEGDADELLRIAFREGLLWQAALQLDNLDGAPPERVKALARRIANLTAERGWLVFVSGAKTWEAAHLPGIVIARVEPAPPDGAERRELWRRLLADLAGASAADLAAELAARYRLTPDQIEDAASTVRLEWQSRGRGNVDLRDCARACQRQAAARLGPLAQRIAPRCRWEDLVLPPDQTQQLRDVCARVRHQERVFRDWGFDRRMAHGRGVSALFHGPPGTGKTIAAEVIAGELGLELYKVDLSGVVSKYIGETEKNLQVIFEETRAANAVLFFDEADALFGKRTEISDARDRYANIETSYLLQKLDELDGVVVMASNFRDNLDDAFTRRIQYMVEFPFPDESGRAEIWRRHFPAAAPLDPDLDVERLARLFPVSGGHIRNIALQAAFHAAAAETTIGMAQVCAAARREFEKIGKLWEAR
jgi:hypothetical protein